MKQIKGIILVVLIQLLTTISGFAQTYKYASSNLNLRSGPNTSYQALTIIPLGTSVEIVENCDCDWIKVYYNSEIGYVNSKYLSNFKSVVRQSSNTKLKYYKNSSGERVQSPTYYNTTPAGATALCRDGTYSFSQSRRGTCSHHGGVARWLQ